MKAPRKSFYMFAFVFLSRLLFCFLLLADSPGPAQAEIAVEEEVQVPILLNVLSFDRNFKQHVGKEIVLGIIFQEKFRQSLNNKIAVEKFLKKSRTNQIEGIPLRVVVIDFIDIIGLKSILSAEKVNIIYITPLRAVSVTDIAALSASLKITSLTGVPEYCNQGITVGIGSKGGNPIIIINLSSANISGNDFSSRLLNLAKVIPYTGSQE